MATLRLKGARGRGFRHAGLELDGTSWTPVEITTDSQRQALATYHGSHIQVHPDDVAELKAIGLSFGESQSNPQTDRKPADKRSGDKSGSKPAEKPASNNSKAGAPATGGDEKKG